VRWHLLTHVAIDLSPRSLRIEAIRTIIGQAHPLAVVSVSQAPNSGALTASESTCSGNGIQRSEIVAFAGRGGDRSVYCGVVTWA